MPAPAAARCSSISSGVSDASSRELNVSQNRFRRALCVRRLVVIRATNVFAAPQPCAFADPGCQPSALFLARMSIRQVTSVDHLAERDVLRCGPLAPRRRFPLGESIMSSPRQSSAQTDSDTRLFTLITEQLRSDDQIETDDIEVSVHRGEVTLTGSTHGRWSSARAEDIVSRIEGVRQVRNKIRPDSEPRGEAGQPAEGGTDSPKQVRERQRRKEQS